MIKNTCDYNVRVKDSAYFDGGSPAGRYYTEYNAERWAIFSEFVRVVFRSNSTVIFSRSVKLSWVIVSLLSFCLSGCTPVIYSRIIRCIRVLGFFATEMDFGRKIC